MREICLDIETTGLDPREGHKIVEIACVEIIDKVRTGNFFHTYVNPRRDMPQEAFAVHGISSEFLQDKPIFDHIVYKFLDFIKDSKLVIHNAAFDTKFINHELNILGLETIKKENLVDTLLIARSKFPGSPNSLDALCKRFGIDLSKRQKHGALLDTELLVDVYVELMGGAQGGLSFVSAKNTEINSSQNSDEITYNRKRKNLPKRDFAISSQDLEMHKEFISKNFKSNFWGY
ncbi:MAG: DNA polymerase III subunit epsilon [Pelagibacterales bacterium]|nr:DNA polymerase III subunit epsilon [Pelagibacterales bacterium]